VAGDLDPEWITNVADAEPSGRALRRPGFPDDTDLPGTPSTMALQGFGTLSPVDALDRGLLLRRGEVRCSHGSSIEGQAVLDGS
jgi:hypothetical protein